MLLGMIFLPTFYNPIVFILLLWIKKEYNIYALSIIMAAERNRITVIFYYFSINIYVQHSRLKQTKQTHQADVPCSRNQNSKGAWK